MKNTQSVKQMFRSHLRSSIYAGISLLLVVVGLLPLAVSRPASAAQITSRSLTLSSGVPSATGVTYTFGFSLPTSGSVQGLKFQACTVAVGTCGTVTGLSFSSATFSSQSFTNATNFAVDGTGAGNCTASATVLCAKRTQVTAETGAKTIAFGGITNPSTANTAFFVRITTFSDTAYATAVDTGTTASAVVQTLTVNAAVAEILNFCVGATAVNDATTSVATDCTGVTGTSVNLGTLDPTSVNITPVSTNGGDSNNAVAMIRTNASGGATVYYDAVQQAGTNHKGTLRISGATCSASVVSTDQCINAASSSQTVFNAGTEDFGMTVAGVNCGSTSSYTCVYSSGSNNLQQSTNYVGGSSSTSYGASATKGFAWDETGTPESIASSTGSTTKVIDDEALIIKFAATPSITTPFGAYTAQSDFIAVPAY